MEAAFLLKFGSLKSPRIFSRILEVHRIVHSRILLKLGIRWVIGQAMLLKLQLLPLPHQEPCKNLDDALKTP